MRHDNERMLGESPAFLKTLEQVSLVAPLEKPVLIVGERGTGKELIASRLHFLSNRWEGQYVKMNCAAIAESIMESELFGHDAGAFTGASKTHHGRFERAHGGTLFLDELCEMELEMQKKLLRFLQTGTFTPLGATKEMKVDVRIICATNRDPLVEVEQGRFREDLYYRVHVVPIEMPPLRERGNDIVTLATHFLKVYAKEDGKKFSAIHRETESTLKRYNWPGNVRQLQNIIRNIVVLNDDSHLRFDHLPVQLTSNKKAAPSQPAPAVVAPPPSAVEAAHPEEPDLTTNPAKPNVNIRPMWQIEREAIQQAIDYCDGHVLNAAVLLELSPSTVYRKKQAWESEDEQQLV